LPEDSTETDTVFGKLHRLSVVPTAVKEVVLNGSDAIKEIYSVRQELQKGGKTDVAFKAVVKLQASLENMNSMMAKIQMAAVNPDYARVLDIAGQLKEVGNVHGEKIDQIFDVSPQKANDPEYLQSKLMEFKKITDLSRQLAYQQNLNPNEQAAVVKTNW
jgi:hypothetical protein